MAKALIDEALFEALAIERAHYRVVGLLPLVHVAWADGSIARAERRAIVRLGRQMGWLVDGGDAVLERWLDEPPDGAAGLALVAELLPRRRGVGAGLVAEPLDLLQSCVEVARAAGGRLGFEDPIGAAEAVALIDVAEAFGIADWRAADTGPADDEVEVPPGPAAHLAVIKMFELFRDPAQALLDAFDDYGDVFRLRAANMKLVIVASAEGAQRVLVDNADNYVRGQVMAPLRDLSGDNMVTADGAAWRRRRRTAQPAFRERFHEVLFDDVRRVAAETVAGWMPGVLDVDAAMSRAALRMIGKLLCGVDFDEDDLGDAIRTIVAFTAPASLALSLPLFVPTPTNVRFVRARKRMFVRLDELIEERRASPDEHHDLLAVLGRQTDAPLDDAELRTEMLTFVIAGHETTGATLTWALCELASQPELRRRVEEEVRRVGIATVAALARLVLLERVLLEAMRLYAPAPSIPRACKSEDRIGGYRIEAGCVAVVTPWLIHRHPKLWPEPNTFDPDRFLPERVAARHRAAHIPFGAGPHKCIGRMTAMMEMKVMLATILLSGQLDHVDAASIRPALGVALRPHGGLPMRFSRAQ